MKEGRQEDRRLSKRNEKKRKTAQMETKLEKRDISEKMACLWTTSQQRVCLFESVAKHIHPRFVGELGCVPLCVDKQISGEGASYRQLFTAYSFFRVFPTPIGGRATSFRSLHMIANLLMMNMWTD